jgi:hypothetical protein
MATRQVRLSVDSRRLQAALKATSGSLTNAKVKAEIKKLANAAKKEAVIETPERFTKNTKRGWKVVTGTGLSWVLKNDYRAMRYLETGTRSHGPKRANRMFIPLTKKAHRAGPKGVFRNKKNFKMGKGGDYILAKRVRGVKPLYITRNLADKYAPLTEAMFDRLVAAKLR